MLTDDELRGLCRGFGLHCKGISLQDELPAKCTPGFWVYNLDKRNAPVDPSGRSLGTHWTCSLGDNHHVFYFDSYAAQPPEAVARFLKTRYEAIYSNNYIVQQLQSEHCGWFVIGLAVWFKLEQRRFSSVMACANEYINMFVDEAGRNDRVVGTYLANVARKKRLRKVLAFLQSKF